MSKQRASCILSSRDKEEEEEEEERFGSFDARYYSYKHHESHSYIHYET